MDCNGNDAASGAAQLPVATATAQEYAGHLRRRSLVGLVYRRHWLYPRVSRRLPGRTLDVGCGIGDFLEFRPGTVGVDVNEFTVAYCTERGLDARVMRPGALPFADASFDSAIMDNVLEHIREPQGLLRELGRVLRPGGNLVIGVPGELGWAHDDDHKVFYDEKALCETLGAAGFRPVEIFYAPLWKSAWLSRRVRQYCIYGSFRTPAP